MTTQTPTLEDKQRRRESRKLMEQTIEADFKELASQYPKESVTCLFETLADRYRKQGDIDAEVRFPKTGQGVRAILVRNGIYKVQQGQ